MFPTLWSFQEDILFGFSRIVSNMSGDTRWKYSTFDESIFHSLSICILQSCIMLHPDPSNEWRLFAVSIFLLIYSQKMWSNVFSRSVTTEMHPICTLLSWIQKVTFTSTIRMVFNSATKTNPGTSVWLFQSPKKKVKCGKTTGITRWLFFPPVISGLRKVTMNKKITVILSL